MVSLCIHLCVVHSSIFLEHRSPGKCAFPCTCPVLTCVPDVGQAAAGPSAKAIIVAGAGHGMHGHERECVDAVMALLDKLPRLSD